MNVAKIYIPRTLAFVLISIFACGLQAVGQAPNQQSPTQNSTRKIRVKPSAQANRIGSAIKWETKFEVAAQKSKELDKPIFWYVPTLRGTFMDRKKEIDRYVRASLFSWPVNIDTINANFIPFRGAPSKQQQKQFDLVPFKFVEPGFLILQPDGQLKNKVDRLTTIHRLWLSQFFEKLRYDVKYPVIKDAEEKMYRSLATRKYGKTIEGEVEPDLSTEHLLLKGMIEFRKG